MTQKLHNFIRPTIFARRFHIAKRGLIGLAAASMAMTSGPGAVAATTAQGLQGTWLMENRKAEVKVYPCGDALCGKVSRILKYPSDGARTDIHNGNKALRNRPLVGLPVLLDFTPDKDAMKGEVYDPKSGRTYRATITQDNPNKLNIKACLLIICKSQQWTRIR
ncbi:DUF2147 domain-containing protein [Novosphingopyxis baekryungensis]|uniref:DUF2147 domain-containing protein n=1 Tax=Novosphingopyxis baekryungensis TaxID=279369 RepID=UPI0003B5B706|nr:DUF2147 domain-containing protein [Novosphingopyxis baekryungensis]